MARSFKGKEINMNSLIEKNKNVPALGRSNMNARGDLLGKGGVILKTREELEKTYVETNKFEEKVVNLKSEKPLEETINEELDKEDSSEESDLKIVAKNTVKPVQKNKFTTQKTTQKTE